MQMDSENQIVNLLESSLDQLEFQVVLDYISKFSFTEYGKQIILNSRPNLTFEQLNLELELLEETIKLVRTHNNIPFENFGEVQARLYKSLIENAVLNTSEILSISNFLRVSRLFKNFIESIAEDYPNLWQVVSELHTNRILEKHIGDAVDETGNVRDSASRELARIRQELIQKSAKLRRRIEKILKDIAEDELVQDEFVTIREGRFVIPIKVENKRRISGIIHGVSQTGLTVFIEPTEIIEMNNEISLLQDEERREIYRILKNLTQEISTDAHELLRNLEILAHFDSLLAKAKYAVEFNCLKPAIISEKYIYLQDIRHPILVHSRGLKKVVPLSIEFNGTKRGHLISGPNAGGKTVALKSIGLNIAMALSGFFPLGYCKLPLLKIFTSIGDLQSVQYDLSTFSSQILRYNEILSNSDSDTLVLIDEIGTGTDPQEGSALAASLLESFVQMKLFFVATTHHSLLKTYALSKEEIENDSLEFDEEKLQPTYRFLQGVPGNSYAFELAKLLNFPNHIIERARNFLGASHSNLDENIRAVYRLKIQLESLKSELEQERNKFKELNQKLEEKLAEIKAKRKELLDDAKLQAYELIQNANALIENTIRQIKEEKKSFGDIKKEFAQKRNEIIEQAKEIFEKNNLSSDVQELKEGDLVYLENPTNVGKVIQVYPDQDQVLVDVNGLKFKVNPKNLKKLVQESSKAKQESYLAEYQKFSASVRIDVRGMRSNEAIKELEKYISDAILSNVYTFTIIHGKGTGALREALHSYLSEHPLVESFREGTIEEGGAGVTVVTLK